MPRNRNRTRIGLFAAALATGLMAFAPLADARVGGGSSSGSRGSRTQSAPAPTQTAPNAAQPMQRTQQPTNPSVGSTGTAGASAAAAARPSASRGFMGGLMGGLLGAGLIGMLFGAGLFGGLGGFASILGLLFQVALVGGVIWLVMRLIRGRRQEPAYAGAAAGQGGNTYARQATQMPMGGGAAPMHAATMPFNPSPADFQAFEQVLKGVNAAWTARDMGALNRLATPEMVGYFNDDYAALDARGWRNETRDLTFDAGDLSEAWHEGGQDYATVAMKFSMIDVTRRVSDNAVVEGDPNRRTTATEIWTFVRPRGGDWLLSAIQQAA
ncbi:MAG: TIM44-like domain-containing protein [Pseudomonadota bacterium]